MSAPDEQPAESVELVRPYVITNGREIADGDRFELVTLITAAEHPHKDRLDPEKRGLVDLCEGGYLSVAEIAGHLRLPVGIVKVLLSDLADAGFIHTRAPVPRAQLTDIQVLQEVLDGLQARFG
ncbi:DUF742 domain-containing protein [Streptomyces litchfieldiae]|uniref:DUF742 domain-containing protein n=1 Tax=Streptomyces litchfieldiae TaxID=3075543 RepID=A0ABU2MTF5_9ACTN|nr:DUF742 domain-containing protein [Streptomyces sp. DSM 44938]MDT0344354.1 DUF742 domain-containing protein [Streptomyces sp. DSM 44938]